MKLRLFYIVLVVAMLGFSRVPRVFIEMEFRLKLLFQEGGYALGPYGNASRYFALVSMPFFVLTIVVGYLGRQYIPKVSLLLIFSSLAMLVWSAIMYSSPRAISPSEVSIAWYAYSLVGMILGVWAYRRVGQMPKIEERRSDILDDF